LDIEKVGVQDNFFDIGGHSLMATQLISKIREIFQCEIPLRDIFDEPNIENLAKISELPVSVHDSKIIHIFS
jgi:acyl carrier protein